MNAETAKIRTLTSKQRIEDNKLSLVDSESIPRIETLKAFVGKAADGGVNSAGICIYYHNHHGGKNVPWALEEWLAERVAYQIRREMRKLGYEVEMCNSSALYTYTVTVSW